MQLLDNIETIIVWIIEHRDILESAALIIATIAALAYNRALQIVTLAIESQNAKNVKLKVKEMRSSIPGYLIHMAAKRSEKIVTK